MHRSDLFFPVLFYLSMGMYIIKKIRIVFLALKDKEFYEKSVDAEVSVNLRNAIVNIHNYISNKWQNRKNILHSTYCCIVVNARRERKTRDPTHRVKKLTRPCSGCGSSKESASAQPRRLWEFSSRALAHNILKPRERERCE